MVYGSDAETLSQLRAYTGGEMLVDARGHLPTDPRGFYMAGDERANENAALTSMHTLFVREHNRLAKEIVADDPSLTDQEVFDQARAKVTAQIQAVTNNEFLPVLFGEHGVKRAMGEYEGYTGADAQISNAFATAAFRFGHSMVSDTLKLVDADGKARDVKLSEAFFNPSLVARGGIDQA